MLRSMPPPPEFLFITYTPGEESQRRKKLAATPLGGVPCTNSAIVLVTKHFYLMLKQWRSEAEHGRWPQWASLMEGNSQLPRPGSEASCCFTASAGIPATGRHTVVLDTGNMALEPACSGESPVARLPYENPAFPSK